MSEDLDTPNPLKRQRIASVTDISSTSSPVDQVSESEIDSSSLSKRQNNSSIDPEEGLSVSSNIQNIQNINGETVELEVIESSSSSSSSNSSSDLDSNSDLESNNKKSQQRKNSKNDEQYENSSDEDSDDDPDESGLTEYQFDELNEGENELDLNLYDKDCKLPPLNDIKVTKKICSQVRRFIKSEGHVPFLDLFLPSGPTANDILKLTNLLGYKPVKVKQIFSSAINPLEASICFLRGAINNVLKSRTRLIDFNKIIDVVNALKNAQNILVLTGAGISTSLGIPDFRSSQGFYSKMKNLGLDDPQDVFSLEIFKRDPSIFYSIAYMILPPDNAYTPLHSFIKLLQDKGKLLRNYTQNIDNLEANSGITADKIVQCHGSFATASCVTCKYKIPGETLYPNLRAKKIAYCPFCENERKSLLRKIEKMEDEGGYSSRYDNIQSFGVMKPDITFFGENLPERYHNTIKEDVRHCDLLITIGTSLKVAPVSDIVNKVPNEVPQILINRDPINHCEFDVELLGYCDQVITWLCGNEVKWNIDHKDFDKILHSGLEMKVIDEEFGRYKISDENERMQISLKKLEEAKIKEELEKENENQQQNNKTIKTEEDTTEISVKDTKIVE